MTYALTASETHGDNGLVPRYLRCWCHTCDARWELDAEPQLLGCPRCNGDVVEVAYIPNFGQWKGRVSAAVQADLAWKRLLERGFAPTVTRLWAATSVQYTRELRERGWYTSPHEAWQKPWTNVLSGHYQEVSEGFSGNISGRLPAVVKPTGAERQLIDDTLARALTDRAAAQTQIINSTTDKLMEQSATAARRETQRLAVETGVARSAEEEALEAGRTLERRLAGRSGGITSLETQAPAEMSKMVEAEVLLGHTPQVAGGAYSETGVIKTWWSMGDDIARDDHLMADQQEQQIDQPYTVGPDQLMVPGDSSLGAPIGQVINCRCASVIDEEAIAQARAERGLGDGE